MKSFSNENEIRIYRRIELFMIVIYYFKINVHDNLKMLPKCLNTHQNEFREN